MDTIVIAFSYEREAYIRAMRLYLRKSGATPAWALILLAAVLGLIGFLIFMTGVTPMVVVLLVLTAAAGVMGFTVWLVKPGRHYDRTPVLRERCLYRFSLEDIGVQNETGAGVLPWNFTRFWITPTDYYLVRDAESCLLLPRSAFEDADTCRRFEDLVMAANPGIKRRVYGKKHRSV